MIKRLKQKTFPVELVDGHIFHNYLMAIREKRIDRNDVIGLDVRPEEDYN